MNKVNYDTLLEDTISKIKAANTRPSLLLHACCAPCSSAVLERIAKYFKIDIFYYNPNITPKREVDKRIEEVEKLLKLEPGTEGIRLIPGKYDPESFEATAKGREMIPEGGERCYDCYELRLRETAVYAKEHNYDYFSTTLSISPYKRSQWLNEIGGKLAEEFDVPYLYSDFKKKNGYRRSIELSEEYGLYRQNYCGCKYSLAERERKIKEKGDGN
ncbi:MAG: epoxyqueuosine reductase QueH [Catonella sp.]|nr:epoxyqueuosine reductase QueH [Catonella sp.]MDY6356938.1 epoxyqueuosine reductase QueH [Catonella sp.]